MRKIIFALLFVVVANSVWAQCYQNEEIQGEEALNIYDYFCTGYWLYGTLRGTQATLYIDSREDEFHICGLSDETHHLCTYLIEIEISEDNDKLIVSGEARTYTPIFKIEFKTVGDFVQVKTFDKNGQLLYESRNFEWYSY